MFQEFRGGYLHTPDTVVTVTRHDRGGLRCLKWGHKMNVTYVLQGEPSVLVSIAAATASRAARLAVCAVVHHVRSTRFT